MDFLLGGWGAQVAEAKQQLEAADSKLLERQRARETAEEALQRLARELEEAQQQLEACKERRVRAEELLKDRRAELIQVWGGEDSIE